MGRLTTLLGMVAAALLVTGSAEASVEMCADPTMRVTAEMQAILQAAVQAGSPAEESELVAVADVPTPQPGPLASPPPQADEGGVLGETGDAGPWSATPDGEPTSDDDVPWCATPDDPRCAPIGGGSPLTPLGLRTLLTAVTLSAFEPPCASADEEFYARPGLGGQAGISSRVERPPRPHRRVS